MLSHWAYFTLKFFMIWFHKILKLIFQMQPSCPRNICTEHWRKLPNLTAFLEIFLYLKETPNYQHILILFTSQPCRYKVIQSNLLLIPLYIHKLQFIPDNLRSSSSSHGQLRWLVFVFSHWGSQFFFWNVTLDYS